MKLEKRKMREEEVGERGLTPFLSVGVEKGER